MRRCDALAIKSRSNGVPVRPIHGARQQTVRRFERRGDRALALHQLGQSTQVGRHFRPFSGAHLLRDLEERNRADKDCVRVGDLAAGAVRNAPVVGQRPRPDVRIEQKRGQKRGQEPAYHAPSSSASNGAKKSGPSPRAPGSRTPNLNSPWGIGTSRTTGLSPFERGIPCSFPANREFGREPWRASGVSAPLLQRAEANEFL